MALTIIQTLKLSTDLAALPFPVGYTIPTPGPDQANVLSTTSTYIVTTTPVKPILQLRLGQGTTDTSSLALSCILGDIGQYNVVNGAGVSTSRVNLCAGGSYLSYDNSVDQDIRINIDILQAIADGVITADMPMKFRFGTNNVPRSFTPGWYFKYSGSLYLLSGTFSYSVTGAHFTTCPSFVTPDATNTATLGGVIT